MVLLTAHVRWLVRLAILTGAGLCAAPSAAQGTLETQVKAVFLYNFTKFIAWPTPAPGLDSFHICAVAGPEFTRTLDRTIAGESVDGRPLVRSEPHSPDDVRKCAILYVGQSQTERAAPLIAAVRDLPVLTVGEGRRFIDQGGAIAFVLENNRVRFDINILALQRAGLKASSKLLRVARAVEGGTR